MQLVWVHIFRTQCTCIVKACNVYCKLIIDSSVVVCDVVFNMELHRSRCILYCLINLTISFPSIHWWVLFLLLLYVNAISVFYSWDIWFLSVLLLYMHPDTAVNIPIAVIHSVLKWCILLRRLHIWLLQPEAILERDNCLVPAIYECESLKITEHF